MLMCLKPDTLVAVIVGPLWLGILVAYYYYYGSGLNKRFSSNKEDKDMVA